MKVWNNYQAFKNAEKGLGTPHEYNFKTSGDFDKGVMDYFQEKMSEGTEIRSNNANVTTYKLTDGYNIFNHNCTTICVDAIDNAKKHNPKETEIPSSIDKARSPDAMIQAFEAAADAQQNDACASTPGCHRSSGGGFVVIP